MSANADKNLSQRVRARFLVAADEEHLVVSLREIDSTLPEPIQQISAAFAHNIRALVAAATIPFRLASTAVHRERFQQLHIAERIRAQSDEEAGATPEEAKRRAYQRASDKFKAELTDNVVVSRLADRTCEYLLEVYEQESFAVGAQELLRQAAVLAWGAFEVLSRDLLRAYFNLQPGAALALSNDLDASKHFHIKNISIEVIADLGFDVSERMGDLVTSANDLSKIEAVRAVYKAAAGDSQKLVAALTDRRLWNLCKTRHLIVHKRGIADEKFRRDTGSLTALGSPIEIAPGELESYVAAVVDAASLMLAELGKRLAAAT